MKTQEFEQIFPLGKINEAYAPYFIGQSYLMPLASSDAVAANITFEPGCRNNWHIHRGSRQLLLCTAGTGWYQEEGKPARLLHPGDVVDIPTDLKHWHGSAKDSWFSHIAISVPKEGTATEWYEPVSEEEYGRL